MAYPNHNIPFHIYTNASDFQMGTVIIQQKSPFPYWSCKLTDPQCNYQTMEKNSSPLSWPLKSSAPCFMMLCYSITAITKISHLPPWTAITCWAGVCTWKNSQTILYLPGKKNVTANAFSQLLCCDMLPIQWGKLLLLASSTSPLKALTSAMTLICSSASSIYHYPMLLRTTMSASSGYTFNRTQPSSLLQILPGNLIDTSIRLLIIVQFYVIPFLMKISWHNGNCLNKINGDSTD